VCHRLLAHYLAVPLELVTLHQRQHIRCMHDGVPHHLLLIDTQRLLREQWIGRGGPLNCPPRSTDALGPSKEFGALSADQWHGAVTTARAECLSGDLSVTRNFRQSLHLWTTKLKIVLTCMRTTRSICYRDQTGIAHTQQALVSERVLTGILLLI
jgi:hypothetical protein